MKEPIVFMVGVYRSGTSLLCSLLNQHPDLALMYECDVWNFPNRLLPFRFKHNWLERMEFYNQSISRHGLVPENGLSRLAKVDSPADLYEAFKEMKGATVGGEKSPFYCPRLEQLYQRFPHAAFILVWRNPVEVYRSVLKAGKTSRFFGKPGMLSRMIHYQEQAIRQAAVIEKKGARIYRVDYARMVDETEAVCREICEFLGVPFNQQMLELKQADLSHVYHAPHHAYLRRGVIERQTYTEQLVPPAIEKKLEHYRRHWEQLQDSWLNGPAARQQTGPSRLEFACDLLTGKTLTFYDSLVRAVFEFLPLSWLRTYRGFRNRAAQCPDVGREEAG